MVTETVWTFDSIVKYINIQPSKCHLSRSCRSKQTDGHGDFEGKAAVDVRFLHKKAHWGVLRDNLNPAGILYMDIEIHEVHRVPGHQLRRVTVSDEVDDDVSGLENIPRGLVPQPHAEGDWSPTEYPAQFTNFFGASTLVWEFTRNELEQQEATHTGVFHTGFTLEHGGRPFLIKGKVDGELKEKRLLRRRFKFGSKFKGSRLKFPYQHPSLRDMSIRPGPTIGRLVDMAGTPSLPDPLLQDQARVVRNHRHLLQLYFGDLRTEELTAAQARAIEFLRRDDSSQGESGSVDNEDPGDLSVPNLECAAEILTTGQPYTTYKDNLQNFPCSSTQRPCIGSQVDERQQRHLEAFSQGNEDTPVSKTPLQKIRGAKYLSRLLSCIKKAARPKAKGGYRRIEWQCDHGVELYADFLEDDDATVPNELAFSLQNPPGTSRANTPSSNQVNTAAPSQSTAPTGQHGAAHPNQSRKKSKKTRGNKPQRATAPSQGANATSSTPSQPKPKFLVLCVNGGGMYVPEA
ncbi:hypothetical protein MKZ38_005450 [Zalerion maritima]|uniref:Uncharacterized protein n=1 Tax=Zalerion maritima TaxID=339359 RepID=A0AAD5RLA4_9PEZI|nr:hypothetical protein MKZ38_005450 [Zalerion maritima]